MLAAYSQKYTMLYLLLLLLSLPTTQVVLALAGCTYTPWTNLTGIISAKSYLQGTQTPLLLTATKCIHHGEICELTNNTSGEIAQAVCLDGAWYPANPFWIARKNNTPCARPPTMLPGASYSNDDGRTWISAEVRQVFKQWDVVQQQCPDSGVIQQFECMAQGSWTPNPTPCDGATNLTYLYWPFVKPPTCTGGHQNVVTSISRTAMVTATTTKSTIGATSGTTANWAATESSTIATTTTTTAVPMAAETVTTSAATVNDVTVTSVATGVSNSNTQYQQTMPQPTLTKPENTGLQSRPSQLAQQFIDAGDELPTMKKAMEFLPKCDNFAPNRASPSAPGITYVKPVFSLDRISEISTIDETIEANAMLLLSWPVTCPEGALSGQPPGELLVPKKDEVWLPAFLFMNTAGSNTYMQNNDDFGEDVIATVRDKTTLAFSWVKDGKFRASCDLDLARFPFDTQTCVFSFALARSAARLAFSDPQFLLYDTNPQESDEWQHQGHEVVLAPLKYKGRDVCAVHFSITLKRNPSYYVTNLFVPNALLIVSEIASFLLPPSAPDRPALTTTILLAMTVAQSTLMGNVPRSAKHILLADSMAFLTYICVACLLYQLATCMWAIEQKESAKPICRYFSLVRLCDLIAVIAAITALAGIVIYFMTF